MLQLRMLSGKTAGTFPTEWVTRRFPVQIGRSSHADLRLEEEGVWDEHLNLMLDSNEGFILETFPNALATVNGQPLDRIILRNGDLIELGSVKMQFFLSQNCQKGLRFREALTWAGITVISLVQICLLYWLIS